MESYEATRAVFSMVQSIDPENASKIMGYILIHHTEKDMIRFAHGSESLIFSILNRAKNDLGLLSNTSSASPSMANSSHASHPITISRPNPLSLSLPSPRLPNNGFNPSSPSSPSVWAHHHSLSPNSLSYAAVVNGSCNNNNNTNGSFSSSSAIGSPQIGFSAKNEGNFLDDYQLQEQNLGFLNDPFSKNVEFFEQVPSSIDLAVSPGCRSDSMGAYPFWENSSSASSADNSAHFHRRSASFNDCYYGTDDSTSGFGFKPCLYYSRGFCKNGNACKFVHAGGCGGAGGGGFSDSGDDSGPIVGSPCSKYDAFEQCQEEIFRSKLAQQQRLAAQLMSGGMNLPYNKLNFLQTEAQRSAAAALMMGEEFHKLHGRVRMSRNDFAGMYSNPGSRQIYLTFPADSTFKEEDVSSYFNLYGPVQDVRIPYQQKRMFGFVTFVYPETVKLILAKGNPHFVCDSRVLVKPYKEKSKLPDKKQHQQQMERGDFSSCSSPSGHDCRDPYEFQLGGRMLYSTQEMLLRKKLEEQADFQQALEFQERRLMNLQLLDLKNQQHQHNASVGSPMSSPHFAPAPSNQTVPPPSNGISHDGSEENNSPTGASDEQLAEGGGVNAALSDCNGNGQNKEDNRPKNEENELAESGLEHILPDNLFASPKKSVSEHRSSVFLPEFDNGGVTATAGSSTASCDTSMPASSPLGLAPHKSCYFEMPRLSPGQGALGM
ncbi:zinc finger CCCH domain-containing protein 53-like [Chenopodium quinoa]|uniref:zinc finger CCCH domain-containing protein 53-like n=1 Tax=Chenopodium quinoa TaxID=63459 RepID=UPI000B7725FB|nr:zinc finger CCCH domain-containing protein 53-like [Chenopodium quinoa]